VVITLITVKKAAAKQRPFLLAIAGKGVYNVSVKMDSYDILPKWKIKETRR